MKTQSELVREGVATRYQINNYVQNGPVTCYLHAGRRVFEPAQAYRIEVAALLSGFIPPSVAFEMADAVMEYRGGVVGGGLFVWRDKADETFQASGHEPTHSISVWIPAKVAEIAP